MRTPTIKSMIVVIIINIMGFVIGLFAAVYNCHLLLIVEIAWGRYNRLGTIIRLAKVDAAILLIVQIILTFSFV